jgi:Big-like domain-containing protein
MMVIQQSTARRRSRAHRRVVGIVVLIVLAACTPDLRTAPHPLRKVVPENGDQQIGSPGQPLAVPLVVRVVDEDGTPLPGVTVQWTADDGGALLPAESTTDASGRAQTVWTLGAAVGSQHADAVVDGATRAQFVATASTDHPPPTSPIALTLTTYDGSGQTVHPDYVAMPPAWPAAHQYLLITPYPDGNAGFENPSIFAGETPVNWSPPPGVSNPIATPDHGYLSDPDAVAVPETGELWVYYRQVGSQNETYLIRSRDGVSFTTPRRVAVAPNHEIVSPTVVRRSPTDWMMWSVNAGAGCTATTTTVELRRSTDGIDWSSPQKVSLAQPGFSPWHIDVQWIPSRNEFWAVFNGKTAGSCTTAALFLATSTDGVQWKTYPSPILVRGASPELADVVYRSTFAYDPAGDVIDFWYSGAKYDLGTYVWRSVYQRRLRSEVFATASHRSQAALAALVPRKGVPPLMDPP